MSQGTPARTELSARGLRVAVCAARWNTQYTDELLRGAVEELERLGAQVAVHRCAGVFELAPLAARAAAKAQGVVAIGCLIRGDTDHYTVLANETARALGALSMELAPRGVAVAFGVLTCDTAAQAEVRARRDQMNKGAEAAQACVEQIRALEAV